jgi:hypothetical protein
VGGQDELGISSLPPAKPTNAHGRTSKDVLTGRPQKKHDGLEQPEPLKARELRESPTARASVCVAPRTYFDRASVCVWVCSQRGDPFLFSNNIFHSPSKKHNVLQTKGETSPKLLAARRPGPVVSSLSLLCFSAACRGAARAQ